MTDLEKRPDAPDFCCFVRDLMRVAVEMYNYVRTTEGQDPITFEDFSNSYIHWADPDPRYAGVENYELTMPQWLREDIAPSHLKVN